MVTVDDVVTYLQTLYPEQTAEEWDAVGLTVGEPEAPVSAVLFAVDVDPVVVEEAIERGVQLVVTHHPLYLTPTSSVAANDPKGRMVHDLIRAGVALYTAHTNADIAPRGVNAALAELLELHETRPLVPSPHPEAHPGSGIGRVGKLPRPTTLADFARHVARRLPATAHGVRVHGAPERIVHRVAVCGGAGDSYLPAAREAGADVYLTADLRHHRASEAGYHTGAPALLDVAHFASEWPWLPTAARLVSEELGVAVHVSELNTDPWTIRLESTNEGGPR